MVDVDDWQPVVNRKKGHKNGNINIENTEKLNDVDNSNEHEYNLVESHNLTSKRDTNKINNKIRSKSSNLTDQNKYNKTTSKGNYQNIKADKNDKVVPNKCKQKDPKQKLTILSFLWSLLKYFLFFSIISVSAAVIYKRIELHRKDPDLYDLKIFIENNYKEIYYSYIKYRQSINDDSYLAFFLDKITHGVDVVFHHFSCIWISHLGPYTMLYLQKTYEIFNLVQDKIGEFNLKVNDHFNKNQFIQRFFKSYTTKFDHILNYLSNNGWFSF